jgi:hypothetical protein
VYYLVGEWRKAAAQRSLKMQRFGSPLKIKWRLDDDKHICGQGATFVTCTVHQSKKLSKQLQKGAQFTDDVIRLKKAGMQ